MRKFDIDWDAAKFLQDLDAKQYKQVASKTFSLMADATPTDHRQLIGYPYQRIDSGEYRIVYRFDAENIYVILIGKRNDDEVYRKLKRKG